MQFWKKSFSGSPTKEARGIGTQIAAWARWLAIDERGVKLMINRAPLCAGCKQ
jgi:hypothetical protein